MAHCVDGFELSFKDRRSWKAKRVAHGKLIDVIPVTWTKGMRKESNEIFQEVWFRDVAEMETFRSQSAPFVVALAIAKDYSVIPHAFDEFRGIFEVIPTGIVLSENSIETRVLRRIRAGEEK